MLWCPLRFPHKTMLGSFSTQLFEGVLMSYCVCLLIVMSNILSYRVFLSSEVWYDFHINALFGFSPLYQLVCRRAHVLSMLFVFLVQHVLTMCVTWQVSHKRQEMLIIDVTWVYHGSFCRVRVAHLFSFCYMVFLCMFAHSDVQHFEN